MSLIKEFSKKFGFSSQNEMLTAIKNSCFSNGYTDFNKESVLVLIQGALEKDLNPFSKEIYVVTHNNDAGYSAEVGMQGWVAIANRQEEYAGVEFDYSDKSIQFQSNLLNADGSFAVVTGLTWIKASVYIKGEERPFSVIEYFDECFNADSEAWLRKPKRRLRKTAFGQAVDLAFHGKQNKNLTYSIEEEELNEFDKLIQSLGFQVEIGGKTYNENSNKVEEFLKGTQVDKTPKQNEEEFKAKAENKSKHLADGEFQAIAELAKVEAKAKAEAKAQALADQAEAEAESKAQALADQAEAEAEAEAQALADQAEAESKAQALADQAEAEAKAQALADQAEAEAKAQALADQAEAEAKAQAFANQSEAEAEMKVEALAVELEEAEFVKREMEELAEAVQVEAKAEQVEAEAQEHLAEGHPFSSNTKKENVQIANEVPKVITGDLLDDYLNSTVDPDDLIEFDKKDFVEMFIEEFTEDPKLVTQKQLHGFLRQTDGLEQQWAIQEMYKNSMIDKAFISVLLAIPA